MNKDVPKILSKVNDSNTGYKVKLRFRKSQYNTSYYLYLDYYEKGLRKTENLSLQIFGTRQSSVQDKKNLQIAYTMRDDLNKKVIQGDTGVIIGKKDEIDFVKFFVEFSKKKPDTNYRISHDHFKTFLKQKTKKESIDIRKIDLPMCEGYKDYLLSQFENENTASHYFITFKATLNYAVKLQLIKSNPAQYLSIKYDKKSIERLTVNEIQKLKESECKHSDLKNGFLFSCFTGLRLGDLNKLRFSDIVNNRLSIVMGKTRKPVEIPLKPFTIHIINEQSKNRDDDRVFVIPSGGRRSLLLNEWFKNAGIKKKLTFHCSRHTFGCLLIENGVDIFTVMKLMGHSDTKTTLQYVEKVGATIDKAIEMLPDV